jgi:NAD(P)-dependent dehydrogenase (short-subunit alcohol dehydrogenase family)
VLTVWARQKRGCSQRRAKVVVADILEHEAEMVAADIRAGGQEAIAEKTDVTSESEWAGLIAKAVATYGKLDILVSFTERASARSARRTAQPTLKRRTSR